MGYSELGGWEGGREGEGCGTLIMTFTVTFSSDFSKRVKTTETERWGLAGSGALIRPRLRRAAAPGALLLLTH